MFGPSIAENLYVLEIWEFILNGNKNSVTSNAMISVNSTA